MLTHFIGRIEFVTIKNNNVFTGIFSDLTIVGERDENQHAQPPDAVHDRNVMFRCISENSVLKRKLKKQSETILRLRRQSEKFKIRNSRLVNKINNIRSLSTLDLEVRFYVHYMTLIYSRVFDESDALGCSRHSYRRMPAYAIVLVIC